jgi:hypothetical protein
VYTSLDASRRLRSDAGAGAASVTDGRDDRGARVSAGIYSARLATDDGSSALKVVMLR